METKNNTMLVNNIREHYCRIPGDLIPGEVNLKYFQLLTYIYKIRNENLRQALACVLVSGMKRKEACELHGISQSQFSIKYRDLQTISQTIVRMHQYIPVGYEGS
ncbi:hypothetical protein JTY81_10370 [Citrobacter freundii]|uniref:Uncharacterized protein n=1 Tax=Citrobacter freundii TaxID=546 RepID=A0AAN4EXM3_CITFR|nr:hypothetical protein [Citrobacter freundii]EKW2110867.1 hypothetical protein [Citrobacter freundii]MBM7187725.1 hypothetical protein [Citrobacter freundii]MBM7251160.1 hypothetical protein [Citrobacter freundii]MBM7289309.1 hypothetical protein [Citrobacter freundii]